MAWDTGDFSHSCVLDISDYLIYCTTLIFLSSSVSPRFVQRFPTVKLVQRQKHTNIVCAPNFTCNAISLSRANNNNSPSVVSPLNRFLVILILSTLWRLFEIGMQKELFEVVCCLLELSSSWPTNIFLLIATGYLWIGLIKPSTRPKSTVFRSSMLCFAGSNLTQSSPSVAPCDIEANRR